MPQTSIPKYQYNSMFLCMCLSKHEVGPSTPTIRRDLIPAILNTLFHNLPCDFPTNIDWPLQSRHMVQLVTLIGS